MADSSCLTWLNFHEHMRNTYYEIFQAQQYTDCRLIVPDGELYANRPILSLASSFFETILGGVGAKTGLTSIGAEMVTILIPDLKLKALRSVLQFIYTGEVRVQPNEMAPFVEACRFLQIRGVRFAEDRIMGIRFGKALSLVEEESIASSARFESSASLTDDFFMEPHDEQEVGERIDVIPPGSDECLVREESRSNPSPDCAVEPESMAYDLIGVERVEIPQDRLTQAIDTIIKQHENYPMAAVPSGIEMKATSSTASNTLNHRLEKDEVQESKSVIPSDPSSYEARLTAAIDAILNKGISYRVASRQYSIAKTVLWRKTMKMPRPVRASSPEMSNQRREAIDALKLGEKLIHVSRRFEIPLSTLHREKQRLYSKGALPSSVSLKLRDKDEPARKRLLEAVGECVGGRMSLSEAARVYGLPKTSIWRRVRSMQSISIKEENSRDVKVEGKSDHTDHLSEVGDHVEQRMDVLLNASDSLDVGAVYMSDENISTSELTQLRIQLARNYEHHTLNDTSQ